MVKSFPFLCLVMASSNIFFWPKASGQSSSSWLILDDNLDRDERLEPSNSALNATMPNVPCNETKHEAYCNCTLQMCLDPDDYVMVNGTAHVAAYNQTYNSSFYELQGECLKICAPDFFHPKPGDEVIEGEILNSKYSKTLAYITIIGLAISMLCIVLHLIAFAAVPSLRNIPGWCMACLCASLLSGYISFLVGFDHYIATSEAPCIAAGASTHFFFLSSLLWMNVISYDVLKCLLNSTGKLRVKSSRFTFKNFYIYCLYAWGVALLFAVAAVVLDNVQDFPEEYKPHFGQGLCWFKQKKALLVFFAAPVFTIICMNVLFFGLSAYTIVSNRMKAEDQHHGLLKRNFAMYVRLAVIMGVSWVSGLLAGIVDAVFLWYIFAILNTMQGFFIFLAFTCTAKVKNHFSSRKFSTDTISPTFRSYYSPEKNFQHVTVVRKA